MSNSRKKGKIYTFHAADLPLKQDDLVVVSTENGLAIGTVVTEVQAVPAEQLAANLKNVIRLATEEDFRTWENNRKLEREAMQFCIRRIAERQLPMKMIDVECLFDKSKMRFLLHGGEPGGLPGTGEGSRAEVPDPHRASADRRAAGGPHHQGARDLRTGGLLRDAPAEPGPGFGQDGQGTEHVPQPREDLRPLRQADVLPGLRI